MADAPSIQRQVGPIRLSERSTGRDNNFNLLRIVAASGVLISHAYPISLGPEALEPFETILRGDNLGRACVFMFFSISGFFITRSFAQRENPIEFLRARALRLYPALIVMELAIIVVLGLFMSQAVFSDFMRSAMDHIVSVLSFSLLGKTSTLPGVFETNPLANAINGSLWTLKYEVLCYLGVLAAGVMGLLRAPRLCMTVFILFAIGYFAVPFLTGRWDILLLMYLAFPFAIGSAFYIWRDYIPLSWGIAAGLIILTALCWWAPVPVFRAMFNIALAYVTFCIGYANTPWLQSYNQLGDYSYGMYIYAFPIQQIVASTGVSSPLENMLLAFPCTLICAIISWHLIEQPAMGFARKPRVTAGGNE